VNLSCDKMYPSCSGWSILSIQYGFAIHILKHSFLSQTYRHSGNYSFHTIIAASKNNNCDGKQNRD
jgi:hypothetical protein